MIRALFLAVLVMALAACASQQVYPVVASANYSAYDLPDLALPLPKPSARRNLAPATFGAPQKLGDIERRLRGKFEQRGYEDAAYYRVPNGFAMASAIERIDDGGRAYPSPDRFALEASGLCRFRLALGSLLDCLLQADPGRYRMIVFVVTTEPVTTDGEPATFAEVQSIVAGGGDFLPNALAAQQFTAAHNISANVYEFARPSVSAAPRQVNSLSAVDHLRAAGLFG